MTNINTSHVPSLADVERTNPPASPEIAGGLRGVKGLLESDGGPAAMRALLEVERLLRIVDNSSTAATSEVLPSLEGVQRLKTLFELGNFDHKTSHSKEFLAVLRVLRHGCVDNFNEVNEWKLSAIIVGNEYDCRKDMPELVPVLSIMKQIGIAEFCTTRRKITLRFTPFGKQIGRELNSPKY